MSKLAEQTHFFSSALHHLPLRGVSVLLLAWVCSSVRSSSCCRERSRDDSNLQSQSTFVIFSGRVYILSPLLCKKYYIDYCHESVILQTLIAGHRLYCIWGWALCYWLSPDFFCRVKLVTKAPVFGLWPLLLTWQTWLFEVELKVWLWGMF